MYVGTSQSGRVAVFVDPSLPNDAFVNASDLVADADRIVGFNDSIFNASAGSVAVIVYAIGGATDGTGGADHGGCDYVTGSAIEVCASYGQSMRCSALLEAELSECNMSGNLCGVATGEALSRWCAMAASNNALADFATAPTWWAAGAPNFVDSTVQNDEDTNSIGCGMAFLSWLQAIGYPLGIIARSMVTLGDNDTLADLYENLTGRPAASAWRDFWTALQSLPGGVSTDDPFAGATLPAPTPSPAPAPAPTPAPPCGLVGYVAREFARELVAQLKKHGGTAVLK